MDRKKVQETIKQLRESSKRKFPQSVDLIFIIKGLDMKKTENQLNFFMTLPHTKGKKIKVCALVGPETQAEAEATCDKTILEKDFVQYAKEKKLAKKLAKEYEFFIAQANIMAPIATAFGKALGPKGKMPNPAAGCIIPPKANIKPLYEKLQKTIRIQSKEKTFVQCMVGTESMNEEELIDNIMAVYDQVIHHVPNERNNIKEFLIKFTMSKPMRLE